jgi:DNA repair exonuclease SbcCD ATPase subunit
VGTNLELVALGQRVRNARTRADADAGAAQELALRGKKLQQLVTSFREDLERHERVTALLTSYGEQRQETAQRQIEELVTRGLQVIFDESISFHLIQSVKGNAAQVDFIIRSASSPEFGGIVVETPVLEARGGGMVVVVAFMLRLIVLLLTPGARRALFLDEPFGMVSAGYEPRVAEFLREVCDKTGAQIVMITHSNAYTDLADVHYETALAPNGATCFKGLLPEQML